MAEYALHARNSTTMADLSVHHIPVCPFCQRLEILLSLKGRRNDVNFHVVDITQPRSDWRVRPWPPKNKYKHSATDEELGL